MAKIKTPDLVMFLVLAVLLLASLGCCYYLYDQINQKSVVVSQLQAETALLEKRIKELPQKREQLVQMENEESRLATFIPNKEGQAEFVEELENLATQSDVELINCTIEPQAAKLEKLPQYEVYKWHLTLSGNYRQLVNFIQGLPLGKRAAMASSLNIASIEPTSDDGKTTADSYRLNVQLGLDLVSNPVRKQVTK